MHFDDLCFLRFISRTIIAISRIYGRRLILPVAQIIRLSWTEVKTWNHELVGLKHRDTHYGSKYQQFNCVNGILSSDSLKLIGEAIIICQFQFSESDFLQKISLKILNSGKILNLSCIYYLIDNNSSSITCTNNLIFELYVVFS